MLSNTRHKEEPFYHLNLCFAVELGCPVLLIGSFKEH